VIRRTFCGFSFALFAAHEKADMVPKTRKKYKSEIKEHRCLILIALHFINYLPLEIRETFFYYSIQRNECHQAEWNKWMQELLLGIKLKCKKQRQFL
jgi:hypothetical protein